MIYPYLESSYSNLVKANATEVEVLRMCAHILSKSLVESFLDYFDMMHVSIYNCLA